MSAGYFIAMLSPVLTDPNKAAACVELLRPQALPNGAEPEEREVISGISWSGYLAFDKMLGDDPPGPRLYYLRIPLIEQCVGIRSWQQARQAFRAGLSGSK